MSHESIAGLLKLAFGSSMGLQMPHMAPGTGLNPGAPKITPTAPKIPTTYKPGPDSAGPTMGKSFLGGMGDGFWNLTNAGVGGMYNAVGQGARGLGFAAKPFAHASDAMGLTQNAVPAVDEFMGVGAKYRDAGRSDMIRPWSPARYTAPPATQTLSKGYQGEMQNRGENLSAYATGLADTTARATTAGAAALGGANVLGAGVQALAPNAMTGGTMGKVLGWSGAALANPTVRETVVQPTVNHLAGVREDGSPVLPVTPGGLLSYGQAKATQSGILPDPNTAPVVPESQHTSIITETPEYASIAKLPDADPQAAKQLTEQAAGQLDTRLKTPEGQTELESLQATGALTPTGQAAATTALTEHGYDTQQAADTVSKMDGWEQLGLWGGLGLAGVGLLHAMSGGGGVGSLLMSLLGLGAAGFTAGRAGLLDQGSKELADGIADFASGGNKPGVQLPKALAGAVRGGALGGPVAALANINPGMTEQIIGNASQGALSAVPDSVLSHAMQMVARTQPDLAAKLDRATGVGSWGNQLLSGLGREAAQTQLQQTLGIDAAQSDRLLRLWAASRQ